MESRQKWEGLGVSRRTARTIRIFSVEVSSDLVLIDIKNWMFHELRHLCHRVPLKWVAEYSLLSLSPITHLSFSVFKFPSNKENNSKKFFDPTPPHPHMLFDLQFPQTAFQKQT